MKKTITIFMLAFFVVFMFSCKKDVNENNPDTISGKFSELEVPEGFTWSTSEFLLIDLKFTDGDQNPVSTSFEIYSAFPGGVKYMDGTSGNEGVFTMKYKIANHRNSIAVVIPNQEPVVVTLEKITQQIGNLESEIFQAKQTIQVLNPVLKSVKEDILQYFPAEGKFGTLAFEDTWPHSADYDFNDVLIDYHVIGTYDENYDVTQINMVLYLRASGANSEDGRGSGVGLSFKHAWSWDGPYADIAEVTVNDVPVLPESTEYPSYILIENVEEYQPTYNTFPPPSAFVYPYRFDVEIIFDTPAADWWEVELPLNNIFIFDSQDRGREIHLPFYLPTSFADPLLAGTAKDDSDPYAFNPENFKAGNMVIGYYTYMTSEGYPWGLNIYFDEEDENLFLYPTEFTDIREAYDPAFSGWVENWDPWDWYLPENGITGKIYETLPNPVYPEME
jgi:LruC domain-containing protein